MSVEKTARPRWCNWHRGLSGNTVLVQIIEAATGPGGMLYACEDCRTQHDLAPLAKSTA